MPTVGVVLQARIGSTRFPGKVLADLGGRPVIAWSMDTLRLLPADRYIIATDPDSRQDIVKACRPPWEVFIGDANDVMMRVITAARCYHLDVIVRATADNPLVDYDSAKWMLDIHVGSSADATRILGMTPGTAVEVVNRYALEDAWQKASAEEREHVMPRVYAGGYKVNILHGDWLYPYRVTIDTEGDLERVRRLING